MATVKLEHVYKKYPNGFEAVKDFNLDIEDKEFIIFVGPSGCGKSTTLRMIAGLEDISSGDLFIDDKRMNDVEPKDRDIAMVFQNYALYPHMTVYENMAFGLKIRKVPKAEIDQKVHEAARILDLEHLLDRKPKALSGGQRQRVAMGRAIVRSPKVFLMDEPLSNLDAKLRGQMRIEISKLHQRLGTTMIYVTHDQTEAMTLGTRIVVMKDGVIQQVDTPQNLYDNPGNKFVAGFIGAPQMNMVDTNVVEKDGGVYMEFCGQSIRLSDKRAAILKEKGYIGKKLTLGIRPEDLHDETDLDRADKNACIQATIRVYEMLGAESNLYFDMDNATWTARVNPSVKVKDAYESYSSLLKRSLSASWGIDSVLLDKAHLSIGLYFLPGSLNGIHPDGEKLTTLFLSESMMHEGTCRIYAPDTPVNSFSEAFRDGRNNGVDYFGLVEFAESENSVKTQKFTFARNYKFHIGYFYIFFGYFMSIISCRSM